jgi:NAD(P)-dependent dehydrogenase (short-subunit alcohol dehydrogenase family)
VLGARRLDRLQEVARHGRPGPGARRDRRRLGRPLHRRDPRVPGAGEQRRRRHRPRPIESSSDADWEWMFETNVLGTVRTTRACCPPSRPAATATS